MEFVQHLLIPIYPVPLLSIRQIMPHPSRTSFLHTKMFAKDGICCRGSNAKNVLCLGGGDSCIRLDQVPHSFNVFNCSSSERNTNSRLVLKAGSSCFEIVDQSKTVVLAGACLQNVASRVSKADSCVRPFMELP